MASSNCDYCSHYVYDDEFDYYTCDVNLDEDEAVKFMQGSFDDCSFYDPYDEYKIVRKQNEFNQCTLFLGCILVKVSYVI